MEDMCLYVGASRVCTCGRVCLGALFPLDTSCTVFEIVPLAPVFERVGEDNLRTVADLDTTGGIEVVELELELEDQVPAPRVNDGRARGRGGRVCFRRGKDKISILENENGFVMAEVAKRTSCPRKFLVWKLWQAL